MQKKKKSKPNKNLENCPRDQRVELEAKRKLPLGFHYNYELNLGEAEMGLKTNTE